MQHPNSKKIYLGVQILRGLAALLVLFYHNSLVMSDRIGAVNFKLYFGQAGVDIFFAISGFVIVVVTVNSWGSRSAAGPFLARRLIRVIPLYWIFTTVKILALVAMPSLGDHTILSFSLIVCSYLFIPPWDPNHFGFPILQPGWTLSFEMLFYACFACMLLMELRKPVIWLCIVFIVLVCLGFGDSTNLGSLSLLLDPLLLEFALGMLVGWATVNGLLLPSRLAIVLGLASLIAITSSNMLGPEVVTYRALVWGLPGALLLISFVSLDRYFTAAAAKLPLAIGEASYSLYLTHPFVVGASWAILSRSTLFSTSHGLWLAYLMIVCAAAIFALLVHIYIEAPMTRKLVGVLFNRRRVSASRKVYQQGQS